jgi:hypothetical protein
MKLLLLAAVLGVAALLEMPIAIAQTQVAATQSSFKSVSASGDIPGLPVPPRGKSTILGGEIRSIDPVRDQLTLKVYGQRPIQIFFDERSQIYRDGKRIPLRDLGLADHASVQTLLDGTNVYALSIHILSQSPEGEYQGRVINYNTDTNELTMSSAMFHEPLKLIVPPATPIARVGQTEYTSAQRGAGDLVRGALISVTFKSDKQGRGVADQISVMATPGSSFVFVGDVASLDMHAGMLSLVDPRDEKNYQVSFDSSLLPASQNLHPGDHIMVNADFDGTHYIANAITINK